MMFRFSHLMALATAGGILVSGCRSRSSASPDTLLRFGLRTPQTSSSLEHSNELARIEAHAHYATGVVQAIAENTVPALDEFYEAVQKDPHNVPLAMEVSQNFIRAGQLEKALVVLECVTNQPDASGEVFARLGMLYFQLNRLEPAAAACRRAIKNNPLSPEAYPVLFQIYLSGKQPKEALKLVDGAVKVPAAPPELLVVCGELYLRLGPQMPDQKQSLNDRALEVLKLANANDIEEPELLFRLAEGFNALGRYDDAADVYAKLLGNFPELPFVRENVRVKLADLFLRINDHQRAADLLKLMIRDNPTDARAYYFLGSLSYELTNYVQAAECYGKTILLNPDFEPAYGELATAQLALNQVGEAAATLETARKKFPRRFVLEYLSGMTASRQKNYTNAVQHFTTAEVIAQATDPKRLQEMFYFQFGSAYERLGDLAQAEKNFLKCLELAPNFDEAQNYLGFMWAEHGTNLDRARELIEKALKTDPKNAADLDSMAWVLFKLNQPQPALEFELKALGSSAEEDAEIYHHLGDIQAALGQPEKAREAWQKSVKLEPNEQVQKKLGAETK